MPKKYKYQDACEEFLLDLQFAGVKDGQIVIDTNMYTMMDHGNPGYYAKIAIGPYNPNPSFFKKVFGNPNSDIIYVTIIRERCYIHGNLDTHLTSIIEQIAKARNLRLEF